MDSSLVADIATVKFFNCNKVSAGRPACSPMANARLLFLCIRL